MGDMGRFVLIDRAAVFGRDWTQSRICRTSVERVYSSPNPMRLSESGVVRTIQVILSG